MVELGLLTTPQAAKRIGITEQNVLKAIQRGDIKATQQPNRRWLIHPDEVQKYRHKKTQNKEYSEPPSHCSVCGGPRTWDYHAYCRTCNNEYRRRRKEKQQ